MPTHWTDSGWGPVQPPRARRQPSAAGTRTADPEHTTGTPSDSAEHTGRDPLVVLLARPARDRAPAAMVWQLLTYDRHTRFPVAEIARRWEPAGPSAGLRPGQDITVPDRIVNWLQVILHGGAVVTGPAHDYAGPASWRIEPGPTWHLPPEPDSPAGTASPARTEARS